MVASVALSSEVCIGTSNKRSLDAIRHALRELSKKGGKLILQDGRLIARIPVMVSPESRSVLGEHEASLAVVMAGWAARIGMPVIPSRLPLDRSALPNDIRFQAWRQRAREFERTGAIRELCEWAAYLQLIDAEIEVLIGLHRPFFDRLARRRWLETQIREEVTSDRIWVWKQELFELEAWIDVNVPIGP